MSLATLETIVTGNIPSFFLSLRDPDSLIGNAWNSDISVNLSPGSEFARRALENAFRNGVSSVLEVVPKAFFDGLELILKDAKECLGTSVKMAELMAQMNKEMASECSIAKKAIGALTGELNIANEKIADLTSRTSLIVKESLKGYAGAAVLVLLGTTLGAFSLYSERTKQMADFNNTNQKSTRFKQIQPYLFMLPTIAGLALGAFSSHRLHTRIQQF